MEENAGKSAYGKRPLWQWVLIYLVIGGILYGIIYYFVFAKGYNNTGTPNQPSTGQSYP